jgi:hypothetical protein
MVANTTDTVFILAHERICKLFLASVAGVMEDTDGHYPRFLAPTRDTLPQSPLDINQLPSVLKLYGLLH